MNSREIEYTNNINTGFPDRISRVVGLLNETNCFEQKKLTAEYLFQLSGIDDTTRIKECLEGHKDIPELWKTQVADTFGINTEWLLYGTEAAPFAPDRDRIISANEPMDILLKERLDKDIRYLINVCCCDGRLWAIIIRRSSKYCYDLYPKLYPLFSEVGATGASQMVSLCRFIRYASRLNVLNDSSFFVSDDLIESIILGESSPAIILDCEVIQRFTERFANLDDGLADDYPFKSFDFSRVLNIVREGIEKEERINSDNDWIIICSNNPHFTNDKGKVFENYVYMVDKSDDDVGGLESEELLSLDLSDEEPYDVDKIFVNPKQITVYQVEHWIQHNMLDLSPEYQRKLVWDSIRKSALIESMMLKIPIPAFYLDEHRDGTKSVIDGMQRLNTIHDYLMGDFRLKNLQYLTKYNGMRFKDLDLKYKSRLEETVLQMNILDSSCPEIVKFDVFRRVNTGGVPLNAQEVRNVMANQRVRKFLSDMTACKEFEDATLNRLNDVRMGAQEICLRYLAVKDSYDHINRKITNFSGLKRMMDEMILKLNDEDDDMLENRLDVFKQAVRKCGIILGKLSFSRKTNPFKINKSIFVAWVTVMSCVNITDDIIKVRAQYIRDKYVNELDENEEFAEAVAISTGSKRNVEKTLEIITDVIGGLL